MSIGAAIVIVAVLYFAIISEGFRVVLYWALAFVVVGFTILVSKH
jgi:hypothetical protein